MREKKTIATFYGEDSAFQGLACAKRFLQSLYYDYGSMESDNPIGISRHCIVQGKWSNMTSEERDMLDGIIESEDFRYGPVHVSLFE